MSGDEKLSYGDFRELFLIELVLAVRGNTDAQFKASDVAPRVKGRFRQPWVEEAARELTEEGLLRRYGTMGGSILKLTGKGLREAEDYATKHGYDELEEEIAEIEGITQHPQIVVLDKDSDAFKGLDAEMARVIHETRQSNALMASHGREGSQRVAELEAGRKLLEGEQIDRSLAERTLLEPLRWLSAKSAEEAVKIAVGTALKALGTYFGFKL